MADNPDWHQNFHPPVLQSTFRHEDLSDFILHFDDRVLLVVLSANTGQSASLYPNAAELGHSNQRSLWQCGGKLPCGSWCQHGHRHCNLDIANARHLESEPTKEK